MVILLQMVALLNCTAQSLNILTRVQPSGGTYDDELLVEASFPEGCTGGKWWVDGGEIAAQRYTGPIRLTRSCRLSVAGTNEEGRIITNTVTQDYTIRHTLPPVAVAVPAEGVNRESFYATQLAWLNTDTDDLDLSAYGTGGPKAGRPVVWLTDDADGSIIYQGTSGSSVWKSGGLHNYKVYVYKNYRPTKPGNYTLHVAGDIFIVDGKPWDKNLAFTYTVGHDIEAPRFTPEGGEYEGEVKVSIDFPAAAFYKLYQVGNSEAEPYNGPITLSESATVRAWGFSEDFTLQTATSEAQYIVTPIDRVAVLQAPVISREGNVVSITGQAGATLKYWLDDKMATAAIYEGPITLSGNCKISAVCYTGEGVSPTANLVVDDIPGPPADHENRILLTPIDYSTVRVKGLSPNGRYACGYVEIQGGVLGFLWDLERDNCRFVSTSYSSGFTSISNDGTALGYRPQISSATGGETEETFYGYVHGSQWFEVPKDMTAVGISGNNLLYGSRNGYPAIYNPATMRFSAFGGGKGCVNCISADASMIGGYVENEGTREPALWRLNNGKVEAVSLSLPPSSAKGEVRLISPNGDWVLIDDNCLLQRSTGGIRNLVGTGVLYKEKREHLYALNDEGVLFGTYDPTLISHESGTALVNGPDNVWRSMADWFADQDVDVSDYDLTTCMGVSSSGDVFLMASLPHGASASNAFSRGMVLMRDVATSHQAPVGVMAQQITGLDVVQVSWESHPAAGETITSFRLYRDGDLLAEVASDKRIYYDRSVEAGKAYTYTLSAVYSDGVESAPSAGAKVAVAGHESQPARMLALRQSGINDVNLTWQPPVPVYPTLRYYRDEAECHAFGTSVFDSEWGVRIPAADMEIYEGLPIRTFQFIPTGVQKSWTINLYAGDPGTDTYDPTPFYTQPIDPDGLHYGAVNTIPLTTPQDLPKGRDLIIGLFIESAGTDNMLGISYEGFRSGLTDLARIDGVHESFVSISQTSTETTEIVLPLGVGVCSDTMLERNLVDHYTISDSGTTLGTTALLRFRQEDVSSGKHEYGVSVHYKDGRQSEPLTLSYDLTPRAEAFVAPSPVSVSVNEEAATATLSWQTPLNDDRQDIHWGDHTPSEGIEDRGLELYEACCIYPVTLTSAFADDYEITDLYFYPTARAHYALLLGNDMMEEYAIAEVDNDAPGMRYVHLETPITVDASVNYRLVIDATGTPFGEAPLALDSSNQAEDGFSNLFNYGYGWCTLTSVLQYDDRASWLMGLVLRQKNAAPMPVKAYNVHIDGTRQNVEPLNMLTYTTGTLSQGRHTATVDAVYADRTVAGEPVTFCLGPDAVATILPTDEDAATASYDLQGRPVRMAPGIRGLYLQADRKFILK